MCKGLGKTMNKNIIIALSATVALSSLCASPLYAAKTEEVKLQWGDISIENARLVEGDSCVSMNLTNHGTMIDALVRAHTAAASVTLLVDQRMHRDVTKIELLPKTLMKIEAGAACIITREFVVPPKAGDKLKFELTFEHDNRKEEIKAVVKNPEVKKTAPVQSTDDAEVVQ
jgi:copper(I)-binding protein